MAGFGNLSNPYVENPYAGWIINVHWRTPVESEPPLSATAVLDVTGPTATTFPPGSYINNMYTTALSGDSGVGLPGVGTLGPTRIIPGGYDYILSLSSTQVPGFAHDFPDSTQLPLGVSLSFLGAGGVFTSLLTDNGGVNGEVRTTFSAGHATDPLTFVVRGILFTDLAYARLIVTVTYTVTRNPTP